MSDSKIIIDIVVDAQKDFITGALANEQAQANVAHLAQTAQDHARDGHWMFFTRDTHHDNYLTTREGRHLPVAHCIEGEDGWNLAAELEPRWPTLNLSSAALSTSRPLAAICCPAIFWMN